MTNELWFEDLAVGQVHETGTYEVTADEIIEFAEKYDPQPFHTDPAAAVDHPVFRGHAASGWHTAAITMRLLVTEGPQMAGGSVGLGIKLDWPSPTRPGDQLKLVLRVAELRRSKSNPRRGVVVMDYDTVNQDGEVRQHTVATAMVNARTDG